MGCGICKPTSTTVVPFVSEHNIKHKDNTAITDPTPYLREDDSNWSVSSSLIVFPSGTPQDLDSFEDDHSTPKESAWDPIECFEWRIVRSNRRKLCLYGASTLYLNSALRTCGEL